MKIKLVRQEDKAGCTIACLAMILGKTYQQVKKDFIATFQKDGMTAEKYCSYAADHGYDVLQKNIMWRSKNHFGKAWMLIPFAPVHIVRVRWKFDTTEHAVVMDSRGKILCPDGKTDAEIRNSYIITEVFGFFPWGHAGPKK